MFTTMLFSCILVFFILLFFFFLSFPLNFESKRKMISPIAGSWKSTANAENILQGDYSEQSHFSISVGSPCVAKGSGKGKDPSSSKVKQALSKVLAQLPTGSIPWHPLPISKISARGILEVASGYTVVSSHTTEIQSGSFLWDSESAFFFVVGLASQEMAVSFSSELAKDGQRRRNWK